jgi:hypothetical protein
MNSLLNGAGALTTLAAPIMLLGLAFRGPIAQTLRRIAMLVAIGIPTLFLIGAIAFYRGDPQFDFYVNYQAAIQLYGANGDPYTVHAAYSFPFPTFYLYWLLGGLHDPLRAWYLWWAVNGVLWAICAILLLRTIPPARTPLLRDLRWFVCAAIPAMVVLWQGQTAIFILVGLVALHYALTYPSRFSLIIGSAGLAFAALIKPQLALVGLGLLIWSAAIAVREPDRRPEVIRVVLLSISAAGIAGLAIALTLLLPGGVNFDTYKAFINEALPQVARASDGLVIGSPAFVASVIANGLGASNAISDLVSTIVTVIMLAVAAWWGWQHRHQGAVNAAAGWGVWAMVIPRVAWTWYAAWCLPFFLLRLRSDRVTAPLTVILLGLLSLQLSSLIIACGTILGLIYLLWTLGVVRD